MRVLLAILVLFSPLSLAEEASYTSKYDGINLQEIVSSERLLNGYINCLLDKGPCTPDGKELKKNLPDAIEHECSKCTERQKEGADQVMHYIIDNRPDDWKLLESKYQSDGTYKKMYENSKYHTADKEKHDKSEKEK